MKNTVGSLIGIALNLYIALGSMAILTRLILPILEHSIFLHLFVSSLREIQRTFEPGFDHMFMLFKTLGDFPGGPGDKNLPARAGDIGSIPSPRRSHMQWGK